MREALKIEPKNPVWLRDLGRMLDRYSTSKQEEEASLREAAQLLEEALALATTKELRASILYRLGDLARHQGDRPRARELLARSLAELPTDAAKSALSSMPP
jgi:tetratricopeptide (TPR) repeat protein